jgi:putative transcriptional regulator
MPYAEIRLLEVMGKKGIRTIKEVHEKSGLSRKAVTKIINKETKKISTDTLARLCKALDCEINDLVVIKNREEIK